MKKTFEHTLRAIILIGVSLSLGFFLLYSKAELMKRQSMALEIQNIFAEPPIGKPSLGQESINIAISVFSIDVPASANYPKFRSQLTDRGLSTREPWAKRINVDIGPSAFTSWALLGSTLAHELEVHCTQNFLLINLLDTIGLDGTGAAERQAYMHEINNAKRFNLGKNDTELIAATMNYYYPVDVTVNGGNKVAGIFSKTLGRWLAKSHISKETSNLNP